MFRRRIFSFAFREQASFEVPPAVLRCTSGAKHCSVLGVMEAVPCG